MALNDRELGFADDIINELGRKNHTDERVLHARAAFFNALFMGGWNTSKVIQRPENLASCTRNFSVPVGKLTKDCPPSIQSAARARSDDTRGGGSSGGRVSRRGAIIAPVANPANSMRRMRQLQEQAASYGDELFAGATAARDNVPKHRRAGAPVLLKVDISSDISLPSFTYTDGRGSFVSTTNITWNEGKTEDQHRAVAIDKFNDQEIPRIGRYNRAMAIYFARIRLFGCW